MDKNKLKEIFILVLAGHFTREELEYIKTYWDEKDIFELSAKALELQKEKKT